MEKIVIECRQQLDEERRRQREVQSIPSAKSEDAQVATVDLKSIDVKSSATLVDVTKIANSIKTTHSNTPPLLPAQLSQSASMPVMMEPLPPSIPPLPGSNPYQLNNMSRHSSFNYNQPLYHHSGYHPGPVPLPPHHHHHHHPYNPYHHNGAAPPPPPPHYYGDFYDPYYNNENNHYEVGPLKKNRSSSSLGKSASMNSRDYE